MTREEEARMNTMQNEKRLIDANAFLKDILTAGIGKTIIEYSESDIGYMIRKRPTVDAVPVSKLEELRDYLYAEDLIFMRGLAELNKLIANCGAKMDGGIINGHTNYQTQK